VVCFGCIVTGYKVVKNLCSLIRKINKNAVIVVGNSVASSIPEILLTKTEADIAVIGEGDVTIVELLKYLDLNKSLDDVEGIYFKKQGSIIATKRREAILRLDDIPMPEWPLFEIKTYVEESKNFVFEPYRIPKDQIRAFPVNTARGCAFRCTFCYHVFMADKYRWRSPGSVMQEIRKLKELYGINYIYFWDELTFFSKKQTEELVDELLRQDLNIYWIASCRAGLLNESDGNLVKKIKDSGCIGLSYSLESADERILKTMNKNISLDGFRRQKKILDKFGVVTWTSLVMGYPEETEDSVGKTMEFCYENSIYPSVGYLLPQPGSYMYKYILDNKVINSEEEYLLNMGDRQDFRINLTQISSQRMQQIVKEYLDKINRKLQLGIQEDRLVKFGHYKAKIQ